jgi:hypothetical protein
MGIAILLSKNHRGLVDAEVLGHLEGTQVRRFLCAPGRPIVINSGNTPKALDN